MQDIEQNMEELFRKAADNYPLKVNDSQWDEIAPALVNNTINIPAKKKRAFRRYTSLLLLFLFLLLSDGIITDTIKNDKAKFLSSQTGESKTDRTGVYKNDPGGYDDTYNVNNLQSETSNPRQFNVQKSFIATATSVITKSKKINGLEEQAEKDKHLPASPVVLSNQLATLNKPDILSSIKPTTFAESIGAIHETDKTTQKGNQLPNHSTGLYFGAVAGPLFNEVKNQGLKKTGFNLGFITGYRFKNHLSFEAGLVFAKKPYYSSGKYFSLDKVGNSMPQGMNILSLEGCNLVWEIPIRVKYDFLQSGKSSFFSSAGITSYIMTKEKNNYLVTINGAQQTMISSYVNKSRSLAATLDISAGYEHKIGKTNYFRIEPYIQIPLKGMGVGSMQMISTGLRIGITKFTN